MGSGIKGGGRGYEEEKISSPFIRKNCHAMSGERTRGIEEVILHVGLLRWYPTRRGNINQHSLPNMSTSELISLSNLNQILSD